MELKKNISSSNLGDNKHSFIGEITENVLKINNIDNSTTATQSKNICSKSTVKEQHHC